MSRRMSVSLTVDPVRRMVKTETRRDPATWVGLKPGDRLTLIEKGMGLPKGAKQVVICEVEILSNQIEPIDLVTAAAVGREGLWPVASGAVRRGDATIEKAWFRQFWCESHGHPKGTGRLLGSGVKCRVITWRYLPDSIPVPPPHFLAVMSTLGSERIQAKCSCGWPSPVVPDRRTAHQAWDTHHAESVA